MEPLPGDFHRACSREYTELTLDELGKHIVEIIMTMQLPLDVRRRERQRSLFFQEPIKTGIIDELMKLR